MDLRCSQQKFHPSVVCACWYTHALLLFDCAVQPRIQPAKLIKAAARDQYGRTMSNYFPEFLGVAICRNWPWAPIFCKALGGTIGVAATASQAHGTLPQCKMEKRMNISPFYTENSTGKPRRSYSFNVGFAIANKSQAASIFCKAFLRCMGGWGGIPAVHVLLNHRKVLIHSKFMSVLGLLSTLDEETANVLTTARNRENQAHLQVWIDLSLWAKPLHPFCHPFLQILQSLVLALRRDCFRRVLVCWQIPL